MPQTFPAVPVCREVMECLYRIEIDILNRWRARDYRPVAAAIIVDDTKGRVLLVKSANSLTWGFPQGGIKRNENVIAGLAREVREETGIVLSLIRRMVHHDVHGVPGMREKHGFLIGRSTHYFSASCRAGQELRLERSEIIDAEWFDPYDAYRRLYESGGRSNEKKMAMLTALTNAF